MVLPIAADPSAMVEEKERNDPCISGSGEVYAQVFELYNCSVAAATLFGPVAAGASMKQLEWKVMSATMRVFVFSGAIPSVSFQTGCGSVRC